MPRSSFQPLKNGNKSDALPPSVVSVRPPALDPGEKEFRLRADATGHRGAYTGSVVEARRPARAGDRLDRRSMTDELSVEGDDLSARVGELRRLTIMFCDVVGSTSSPVARTPRATAS